MSRHWWRGILAAALATTTVGCQWINSRSAFERDPLVMSHLTNDRSESAFAADDQPAKRGRWAWLTASHPGGAAPVQTASRSESSPTPAKSSAAAPDHSWVVGRLRQRRGADNGWYIQYGHVDDQDRYGGELDVEHSPKLGLVREGDKVLLEGEVIPSRSGYPLYRVRNLARLD